MKIDASAYPLYWPIDWPRTSPAKRQRTTRYKISFAEARDRLLHSLELLGARATDVIVSTNIPLRHDGLPRADQSEPSDPGIAVYWLERGSTATTRPRVLACDAWTHVRDNIRAAGLSVEALRALKRSGATQVLERAYAGFAALPAHAGGSMWRQVFELGDGEITRTLLERAYRSLVLTTHPDKGGTHERMAAINAAYQAALREIGGAP